MSDVKICGITCREDAEVAAAAGARYIGAVMYAASPRNTDPDRAKAFSAELAPELVVVVADEPASTVVRLASRSNARVVQLHGAESPETAAVVRSGGPWDVWKAIRARSGEEVLETIRRFGTVVDGFVVDGWHPRLIGGTGVRVRWDELPGLAEELPAGARLIAAGGLTPENVANVVALARPHVVDVSSGVEREPGRKDPHKVRAFVRAVTDHKESARQVDNR